MFPLRTDGGVIGKRYNRNLSSFRFPQGCYASICELSSNLSIRFYITHSTLVPYTPYFDGDTCATNATGAHCLVYIYNI